MWQMSQSGLWANQNGWQCQGWGRITVTVTSSSVLFLSAYAVRPYGRF